MTRVKGPLMSIAASGTIGNCLTFKTTGKRNIVEKVPIPRDKKSSTQVSHRALFSDGISYWKGLDSVTRAGAEVEGNRRKMTGYNFVIREYLLGRLYTLGLVTEASYRIDVDSVAHSDYGLGYPVTYIFSIPEDKVSGCLVYHKHVGGLYGWEEVQERARVELFNGVEGARFDYSSHKVYISLGFDAAADETYLVVVDADFTKVPIEYVGMANYYDDRQAAVVITCDDWPAQSLAKNIELTNVCQARGIVVTHAVITGGGGWSELQQEINEGYVEAASHSRTHPNTVPYDDYDAEIGGSLTDIQVLLNLPLVYKKGDDEYVPAWVEPSGVCDDVIRQKLGEYKYLADRRIGLVEVAFSVWDAVNGVYDRTGGAYLWGVQDDGNHDLATLNSRFDVVYAGAGIYHFYTHAISVADLTDLGYFCQHLDYIKQKEDVWYVGFGALYMYHFCVERGKITVSVN